MLKKSPTSSQIDLFSSPSSIFAGKSLKFYDDNKSWHNLFRDTVTMLINEDIFESLFSKDQGRPNASIRVMISMMIIKESEGISDSTLFEQCRYNLLYRSALGLYNLKDSLPTESTYYAFRKKIVEHEQSTAENLFSTVFSQITKEQCINFNVSGRSVRMDSKLLGSNIAWMSRYELIHKTLDIYYKEIQDQVGINLELKNKLEELLKAEGKKIVFTQSSSQVKDLIKELGMLIHGLLSLKIMPTLEIYKTLERVFEDQYKIIDNQIIAKEKEEISSTSVQSPFDTESTYRNKGGNGQKTQKIKGYSINVSETCNEDSLNLITNVNVEPATTSDVDFLQPALEASQKIVTQKIENLHADGAYNSTENQEYCKINNINLYLHAIQGAKGKFSYEKLADDELKIINIQTNEIIENQKIITKDGEIKWRITQNDKYRYINEKEIDTYFIRKEIENTPEEIFHKRNNVEATIFQLSYHYSNAKSRYRGLIKHKMWANIRCLWINFVRILKNIEQNPTIFYNFIKNPMFFIFKIIFTNFTFEKRQYLCLNKY